jgi:uncharacterized Zn finger protein (UPF0148 family)
MKKKYFCPICGNSELTNMFITSPKGKSISLHLSSQAAIRKSSGEVCCIVCQQTWNVTDFQKARETENPQELSVPHS